MIHTRVNGKAQIRMTVGGPDRPDRNELYAHGYALNAVPQIQIVTSRPAGPSEKADSMAAQYRHDGKPSVLSGRLLSAEEFVEMFNELVPGLHVSYEPPRTAQVGDSINAHQWQGAHDKIRQDRAITEALQLLIANGFEVTKPVDPAQVYLDGLLTFAQGFETTQYAEILPSQGAHHLNEVLVRAAEFAGRNQLKDVEVYVEIDRAMLHDVLARADRDGTNAVIGGELFTHLWPVVARIDEQNDVVLHVTSGERAQTGAGDE